jgi:hypothetical protein
LPEDRCVQPVKLIFAAQSDVSRDQVELNWIQKPASLLDPLDCRAGGEESELNSAVQDGGSATALVGDA